MSAPLFEVVLAPGRYRVRIDERTARLEVAAVLAGGPEATTVALVRQGLEAGVGDPSIIATLVRLGVDAGLLPDFWLLGHDSQSVDRKRLPSALFVSPKLAPCGTCGNWCGIEASRCDGCEADPRVIVEACQACDGSGVIHRCDERDPRDCPKWHYTETGSRRSEYLDRAVAAGILTSAERSAAIVEELP